ncbi:MAG: arsenate reductase/protein-tyrosine-phosphatase family protein [Shimia sp.]
MDGTLTEALSTLAHPGRLSVFRLLMRRHPGDVAAGEIAVALGLKASTASAYLSALSGAGLIEGRRLGTSLRYSARIDGARAIVSGLFDTCCNGRPDLCPPAMLSPEARQTAGPDGRFDVLFVCTGNSARSILMEAILRQEAGDRFRVFSAGTRPSARPHPEALAVLERHGIATGGLTSTALDEMHQPDAPAMDFVFTVCDHAANEDCPVWPGQPITAHWGMQDPARFGTQAAFDQAYDICRNRLRAFAALPVATLGRLALQHEVDAIGRTALERPS